MASNATLPVETAVIWSDDEDAPDAEPLEGAASGPADQPESLANELYDLIHA